MFIVITAMELTALERPLAIALVLRRCVVFTSMWTALKPSQAANLFAVKVLDQQGSGTTSDMYGTFPMSDEVALIYG